MLWEEFTSDLSHLCLSNLCIFFECSSSSFPSPHVHLPLKSSPHFFSVRNKIISALIFLFTIVLMGFPGGSDGKESACNVGDLGSIPGLGRSSGEGNGNPLQYSCLKNPMDRGAWQATAHGVTKSQTRLSDWHTHGPDSHSIQMCFDPTQDVHLQLCWQCIFLNSWFFVFFFFLPGHTLKTSLYLLKPTTILIFIKTLRTPLATQGQNTKK